MPSTVAYLVLGYACLFGAESVASPSNFDGSGRSRNTVDGFMKVQARRYNYTYTPGVGAHKLHTEVASWNEARRNCQKESGHLVIINSEAEAHLVGDMILPTDQPEGWTGAHDLFNEGEFVTIHGEPLDETGYKGWRQGEPNDSIGYENCVAIYPNGEMNDNTCSKKFVYVCELPQRQRCAQHWGASDLD